MQEGTSALVQMQAFAAAIAAARRAGHPAHRGRRRPDDGRGLVVAHRERRRPHRRAGRPGELLRLAHPPGGRGPRFAGLLRRRQVGPRVCGRAVAARPAFARTSPRSSGCCRRGRAAAPRTACRCPPGRPGAGSDGGSGGGGPAAMPTAWAQVGARRSSGREPAPGRTSGWRATSTRPSRSAVIAAAAWTPGCAAASAAMTARRSRYIAQTGQPTTAAGFRTATRLLALAARFGLRRPHAHRHARRGGCARRTRRPGSARRSPSC